MPSKMEAETGAEGQDGQGDGTRSGSLLDAGEPRELERGQGVYQRKTLKEGRGRKILSKSR